MTEISADKVRELREKSGAGMMDCKRALAATAGDLEKAIDHLRKEGVLKATKKAGRATLEGLIEFSVSPDRRSVSLIEMNCETDFVARTDVFQSFLRSLGEHVLKASPRNLDELLKQKFTDVTVEEALAQLIARLGENMAIRRFARVTAGAGEQVAGYLHTGSKIGTIVRAKGSVDEALLKDISMHLAAMAPRYISREHVSSAALEREKEVLKASPELEGKPDAIREKIIQGKLNRFYSEICLLEQPFIKDVTGKKTVGGFLQEKSSSEKISIEEMVRFQVGEEIS